MRRQTNSSYTLCFALRKILSRIRSVFCGVCWTKFETISSKILMTIPKSSSRLGVPRRPALTPLCNSRLVFLSAGVSDSVWKSGFSGGTCFRKNRFTLKQKNNLSRPFSISSVHLWLRSPSSAFASDISARATRAYLSWCGLAFSERLRWKEMSRSGKAPSTIWGEEGILSPASGSSSWWFIWALLLKIVLLFNCVLWLRLRTFGVRHSHNPTPHFHIRVSSVAFAFRL